MEGVEKSTNEWFRLGEIYYRKFPMSRLNDNLKKIQFAHCHIAVARNGGLMAFVKRSKQFIIDITNDIKDKVLIFHQNGLRESQPIKFEESTIVLFEFTAEEELICLLNDGRLYKFDIYCLSYKFDYAGLSFETNHITDAKLFEKGLICLTESGDFYLINHVKDPSATLFFSTRKFIDGYVPRDYLIIPASNSSSERLELVIPHKENGILVFNETGVLKYMKNNELVPYTKSSGSEPLVRDDLGKIINIFISPNNQYIGMLNDQGDVFVFPSNLDGSERNISQTRLSFSSSYQIMWCGEDCIVAANEGNIYLIGPDNKLHKLRLRNNLHIVQEVDGIRIITDDYVEFLQRVSDELNMSIFPLSYDCAKKLLEAYKVRRLSF